MWAAHEENTTAWAMNAAVTPMFARRSCAGEQSEPGVSIETSVPYRGAETTRASVR